MTKKSNDKRIKRERYRTEEQEEIFRFIKILIVIIILILGVYFFTRIFVTKDLLNKDSDDTIISGEIDYTKTIIGAMLNKTEEEYYVLIYNSGDLNAVYYSGLMTTYKRNSDALPIYFADLDNELNKKYLTESSENVMVSSFDGFKVKDLALIKVKKGKIVSSFTNIVDIEEELKYIKETTE